MNDKKLFTWVGIWILVLVGLVGFNFFRGEQEINEIPEDAVLEVQQENQHEQKVAYSIENFEREAFIDGVQRCINQEKPNHEYVGEDGIYQWWDGTNYRLLFSRSAAMGVTRIMATVNAQKGLKASENMEQFCITMFEKALISIEPYYE